MFKGLRSKIEDEANRLKSTVSQYGENIANQVRSTAVFYFLIYLNFNFGEKIFVLNDIKLAT